MEGRWLGSQHGRKGTMLLLRKAISGSAIVFYATSYTKLILCFPLLLLPRNHFFVVVPRFSEHHVLLAPMVAY